MLHRRKQPEAWPQLVSKSEQALHDRKKLSRIASFGLVRKAAKLSDSELERNNFYGYGRVMCGLARRLQQPSERNRLIEGIAAGIIISAMDRREVPKNQPFRPQVGDLQLGKISYAFVKPTRESWLDLPPSEKLLTNTLTEMYEVRRKTAEEGIKTGPWLRFVQQAIVTKNIGERSLTIKAVAYSALGASSEIIKARSTGLPLCQELTNEQKNTPIDMEKLSALAVPKNFMPFGRLRLDEFFAGHGWSHTNPSTFDHNVLSEPPRQKTYNTAVLPNRFERLGCEALFVGNLAVDVATNILPAALEMSTTMPFEQAHSLAPPM